MTKLKCPVCNKPMKEQIDGTCMSYQETDCICNITAPKIIWKEMAALRKKHNIYTKTCRMEKEYAEEELERTKKKLDIAVDALKEIIDWDKCVAMQPNDFVGIAEKAIEQINQKEEK